MGLIDMSRAINPGTGGGNTLLQLHQMEMQRRQQAEMQRQQQEQQAQEFQHRNMKAFLGWADTSEKWNQGIDWMRKQGIEGVDGLMGHHDKRQYLSALYDLPMQEASEFERLLERIDDPDAKRQAIRNKLGIEVPQAKVINDQLVDPRTGNILGDYRDPPSPEQRRIVTGGDGYQYYEDSKERVLPGVERPQEPGYAQLTAEQVQARGLDPSIQWQISPKGQISQIGGGGLRIDNRQVPTPEKGYQNVYDENGNFVRQEPIPGGSADRADRKIERGAEQQRQKLGTSLASISLNINEIENKGLPVTGAIGDFRRTNLGRALTGSSAVDFGNRTNQVTDAAALDEISRMRQNSPTGGAVGALTDGERAAIGNAVTALNNSTSGKEYLRAAKAYRDLALDLAYGQGTWRLSEDGGSVSFSEAQPNAVSPPDFSTMSRQDIEAYFNKSGKSATDLPPREQEALRSRIQEILRLEGGGNGN